MDNKFNELFDDFFKRNKPDTKISDELKEKIRKISEILKKNNDTQEQELREVLGKPDKVEYFNDGDRFFERKTWYNENADDFVELSECKDPTLITPPIPQKSLQQKLDEAVANESFEKAAAIRDEIKKRKNSK